jgi:hypothetical protein
VFVLARPLASCYSSAIRLNVFVPALAQASRQFQNRRKR